MSPSSGGSASAGAPTEPADHKMSVSNKKVVKDTGATLLLSINLVGTRINQLGEHKKIFFASLMLLLEKSTELELLSEIAKKMVGPWITGKSNDNSTPMSNKDKINFLVKMTRFEQLAASAATTNSQDSMKQLGVLLTTFMELVYHVFSDPTIPKSDLSQLELGFMMGLRSKDPVIRNNFFTLFNKNIPSSLSERLNYIFVGQNWEPMGGTFWIKQALDMLLALLPSAPVRLKRPTSASSPYDYHSTSVPEIQKLLEAHDQFVASWKNVELPQLFAPLRELFHQDTEIAYMLWVQLFPIVWNQQSKEEREKMPRVLTTFLAKEYHNKQQRSQPNVVQALLEGISLCTPQPKIPFELVKFLAKTYNSWHVGIKILEEYVFQDAPEDTGCDLALAELYQLLSEDDLFYSLWKRRASIEDTKAGLTLEQHGMWQRAQEVFYNAMTSAQSGTLKAPYAESCLWEEHWIACAKRLNQWDLLSDFARSGNHNDLLLECAWKVSDWNSVKEALTKTSYPPDSPILKVYQCYAAVHEGKPQDIESISHQSIQLSLKFHQTLPDVPSVAHIPTLQLFQQIAELKDSAHIIKEINNNNKNQAVTDIKSILNTWRDRLPNKWDDILVWNDLLTWRQHVFSLVNTALLEVNTAAAFIGHHETAWTINKFSHIARKHNLVEVCLNSLSKIYTLPNIEIPDAFVKLREQVKCYFQLPTTHYRTGLDIINSTNLDYFGPQQKAEFFQLKGEFLSNMGLNEEAHAAFSTAVSLYDSLAKAWVSWGMFCDHQYSSSATEHSGADAEDRLVWAEYAINCYLQGIRCGSEKARRLLPRVLWLLAFDDDNERLAKTFEKFNENLPLWIWINWIPQLLGSLARPEAPQAKSILLKLANTHPQALFYSLRAFMLEKRDHQHPTATELAAMDTSESAASKTKARSQGKVVTKSPELSTSVGDATPMEEEKPSSNAAPKGSPQAIALQYAEEVMASLRNTQPLLATDMEAMVKEISTCLQPEPEELLLTVLQAILNQCYEVK